MAAFYPFRSVGVYTDEFPFALQRLGSTNFVTVPIEKSFQVFNCDNLNVVLVGPLLKKRVRAVAAHKELTFAACGSNIHIISRNREVGVLTGHESNVQQIMVLGDLLLSLDKSRCLKMWNYRKSELADELVLPSSIRPTFFFHPDTYVNKILIATAEGELQLWNIRKKELVYTFPGWNSEVVAISQSGVVDVVAIALKDSRIILHNLRLDRTIFTLVHEGEISALTFRSDGTNTLVSTTKSGEMAIWDLEKQKLISLEQNAHGGPIVSAQFLFNEPILVTAGRDNSIKMWIFDQLDGSPRLLRERTGHSQSPSVVDFYATSSVLLTAAPDKSFRIISAVKHQQSRELSQGHLMSRARKMKIREDELKLPPITALAFSQAKQNQWDNCITCHANSPIAYTWRKDKYVLGAHQFKSTSKKGNANITAVAISSDGHYAIIGSQGGVIDRFNIQSGIHRGTYAGELEHTEEITGLAVDQVCSTLISASLDGRIVLWDFNLNVAREAITVKSLVPGDDAPVPILSIQLNRETGLLATLGEDGAVRVYDITTRSLVRVFYSQGFPVTRIAFAADARTIAAAGGVSGNEMRVYDVPSARCISWMRFPSPITALAFSPRADFVATSHVGSNAVHLWANALYFGSGFLKAVGDTPVDVELPKMNDAEVEGGDTEDEADAEEADKEKGVEVDEIAKLLETRLQLSDELVTLSKEPKSKWQVLLNLDLVQARNKPIEPPKAPPKAPFLLPTMPGLTPAFVKPQEEPEAPRSRIIDLGKLRPVTPFIRLLQSCEASGDYSKVTEHLKGLSPSGVDFEFRSISPENRFKEHKLVLRYFLAAMKMRMDYELIQAYLQVFLKVQAGELGEGDMEVHDLLSQLQAVQNDAGERFVSLLDETLCLVHYLSGYQAL